MDWTLAIRRNREALLRILAALFALVGLEDRQSAMGSRQSGSAQAGDDAVSDCLLPTADCRLVLPRHLHTYALRILRAAEAAIRRLVVIAAREVVARPCPGSSPVYGGGVADLSAVARRAEAEGDGGGGMTQTYPATLRIPAFPLLDPLKRFSFKPPRPASKFMPRICVVGFTEPAPIPEQPAVSPDDPVNATGLYRRLLSSRRALANLPREARRLARWHQRNTLRLSQSQGKGRVSPLRIGHPPGRRKRSTHLVDDILKECHALALDVLDPPNTSRPERCGSSERAQTNGRSPRRRLPPARLFGRARAG